MRFERIASGSELAEFERINGSRLYMVGDRVEYTQPTSIHKGALPHGAVCNAKVIAAFGGDGSPQWPTYRLQLDELWSADRCKSRAGQPIVLGNVTERYLSPLG